MSFPRPLAVERRRIRVTGTVQGVGFRPFVYREATALGLAGFVENDAAGVLVEAEGSPAALAALCRALTERPPPLARVTGVDASVVPARRDGNTFSIRASAAGAPDVPVGVDTAACGECLAEVDDPAARRYRYPFTNCTNCGPRYTIVLAVPYDRRTTTMAGFEMCDPCRAEYEDPADRRFHAQPIACPACGPTLRWQAPDGNLLAQGDDALGLAGAALRDGRIVAVKGIGGYHLAVDATDDGAVARLRQRKARDDKPFALMVPDLAAARRICELDGPAVEALTSHRRPIVLAPRNPDGTGLAAAVAARLPELGLMLPYTPLHHLLMRDAGRPLVMTSGNLSDDPIAHLDDDAVARIGPLVDGLLGHDRPIHVRCDDSVVRATGRRVQAVRRSRGHAPEPFTLPGPARRQVLALGAELKSTVAVAKGTLLVASHHIGDLEHLAAYRSFLQATGHLRALYGVHPEVVAHDLHPEYLSTKHALELDLEPWPVQHHHAHVASCLAEHGRTAPVLGIAFDGLGMGPDGTLWGGELLVADLQRYERVGHLHPVPMPGGAAAVREPWRMALAWLAAAGGPAAAAAVGSRLDDRWPAVLALLERGERLPVTTSAGRLFDAVAALAGVRSKITYEGQAAIELEALAARWSGPLPTYPIDVAEGVLDPRPLVLAIVEDLARGAPPAAVAAGFHQALGRATASLASKLAGARALDTVALSGGVFQNVLLTEAVERPLREAGLTVLVHEQVPPNDGGISIGQAAIAALAPAPA